MLFSLNVTVLNETEAVVELWTRFSQNYASQNFQSFPGELINLFPFYFTLKKVIIIAGAHTKKNIIFID